MKSVDAADYTIAVIGAGAMGQGIAQVAAQGGIKTLLFDAKPGGADAGRASQGDTASTGMVDDLNALKEQQAVLTEKIAVLERMVHST